MVNGSKNDILYLEYSERDFMARRCSVMSIIGEGKYVNFIGGDIRPSWQRMERYDYCEINTGRTGTNLIDRIVRFIRDLI